MAYGSWIGQPSLRKITAVIELTSDQSMKGGGIEIFLVSRGKTKSIWIRRHCSIPLIRDASRIDGRQRDPLELCPVDQRNKAAALNNSVENCRPFIAEPDGKILVAKPRNVSLRRGTANSPNGRKAAQSRCFTGLFYRPPFGRKV